MIRFAAGLLCGLFALAALSLPPGAQARPDLSQSLHQALTREASKAKVVGAAGVIFTADGVVASEGYGFSRPGRVRAVDPGTTLFRLGSMSKPITATAVMQLVEAGKLDLDADINRYLDFTIPPGFGKPITLRLLLTHTAGFSDTYKLIFLPDTRYLLSLGDYVKAYRPPYLYAPGTTPAYSNYSFALAGYIVQRVSGEPYPLYVQHHIFEPLGMSHSTFAQPPAGPLADGLSTGFLADGKTGPFEYITAISAGALSATPEDYSRFLRAILRHGELDGKRILAPASVDQMLRFNDQSRGVREARQGIGLAFTIDESRPSGPVIGHGGDTELFHSDFQIYPRQGIGFVIAQNTNTHRIAYPVVRELEKDLGVDEPRRPAAPNSAEDHAVAGVYAQSRLSDHSILRISLLTSQYEVKAAAGGGITIMKAHLNRVGPLEYQNPERPQQHLYFLRNAQGSIDRIKGDPYGVSLRTPPYLTAAVQFPLIAATLAIALVSGLAGLGVILWRLARGGGWPLAWSLAAAMGAGLLFCAALLAHRLLGFQTDQLSLIPPNDLEIRLFQISGLLGVIAGAMLAALAVIRTRRGQVSWIAGIGFATNAVATIAAAWLMIVWRMLDLTLHY
jgi:CubicO group peptidase (beta-lactamase class C family)